MQKLNVAFWGNRIVAFAFNDAIAVVMRSLGFEVYEVEEDLISDVVAQYSEYDMRHVEFVRR